MMEKGRLYKALSRRLKVVHAALTASLSRPISNVLAVILKPVDEVSGLKRWKVYQWSTP